MTGLVSVTGMMYFLTCDHSLPVKGNEKYAYFD